MSQKRPSDTMDLLPAALAGCDGTTDSDGNVQHYLPVDFPNIGDETFAVRITAETTHGVLVQV